MGRLRQPLARSLSVISRRVRPLRVPSISVASMDLLVLVFSIYFESAQDYQRYLNGDLPANLQRSTPRNSEPAGLSNMGEDKDDTSMSDSDADDDYFSESWKRFWRQRQETHYSKTFLKPPWSCARRQAYQKALSILTADAATKTVPSQRSLARRSDSGPETANRLTSATWERTRTTPA